MFYSFDLIANLPWKKMQSVVPWIGIRRWIQGILSMDLKLPAKAIQMEFRLIFHFIQPDLITLVALSRHLPFSFFHPFQELVIYENRRFLRTAVSQQPIRSFGHNFVKSSTPARTSVRLNIGISNCVNCCWDWDILNRVIIKISQCSQFPYSSISFFLFRFTRVEGRPREG